MKTLNFRQKNMKNYAKKIKAGKFSLKSDLFQTFLRKKSGKWNFSGNSDMCISTAEAQID